MALKTPPHFSKVGGPACILGNNLMSNLMSLHPHLNLSPWAFTASVYLRSIYLPVGWFISVGDRAESVSLRLPVPPPPPAKSPLLLQNTSYAYKYPKVACWN